MTTSYNWRISLESVTGFVLNTDVLNTGQLGFLSTVLDDAGVKIRSVSMSGGRNRELDAIQPSTATIVFDNMAGLFTPDNPYSPYSSLIFPGKLIGIEYVEVINGVPGFRLPFFNGVISEWSWDFDVNGDAIATVSATDSLSILATVEIQDTAAPAETTGARISRILALAGLNASQGSIDTGVSTMAATTLSGNALQLAQQAAFHEQGFLFAQSGAIQFWQRNKSESAGIATFSNERTGDYYNEFYYDSVQMGYSNDSISNIVTTVSALGTATASSTSSISQYGEIAKSYDMEYSTFAEQQQFGNFLVDVYGTPQFRPQELTFSVPRYLDRDSTTGRSSAAFLVEVGMNVGYPISFTFLDPVKGMNIRYETLLTSSFSHSSTPSGYTVTIGLEPATYLKIFRLDSAFYGVLDQNVLAF
jgi:hypothetical protein